MVKEYLLSIRLHTKKIVHKGRILSRATDLYLMRVNFFFHFDALRGGINIVQLGST